MNHVLRIASLFLLAVASTFTVTPTVAWGHDVDAARVRQWSKMLPAKPLGVGRPIDDRAAWEAAKKHFPQWEDIVARAERYVGRLIPEVTDELFLEFSRNGNRSRCESVISEPRKRLSILVLAECLENKGRFLADIERIVRAILKEKTWQLPAHDKGLTNFEGTEITIGLVSSKTAWQLATADYWLGERLAPELREAIAAELERRIFKPFEGSIKHGKPKLWWMNCTNNWNAVCLANVTGTALTAIDSPRRRAFFAAAAEKHIPSFLKGFTPDGYCSEGLGYWNYGFGHFVELAETLYQQSDGRFDLWNDGTPSANEKLRRIARFGRNMEIMPGVYAAFADCGLGSKPLGYLSDYLDRRLGVGRNEDKCQLVTADTVPRNLPVFGIFAFPNSASRRPAVTTPGDKLPPVSWFVDAGTLICRPGGGTLNDGDHNGGDHNDGDHNDGAHNDGAGSRCKMGVAIKGGHNAEHHNHNDVGTFMVVRGEHVPLVDPGSEVYTRRTFSRDRYKSGVLNSWGHPVPRVAGKLQRRGRRAAAKVLSKQFEDETDTIVFDLRSAYDVKPLQSLVRTFVYSRKDAGNLSVTDRVEFDSPQSFGTALITFDKWEQLAAKSDSELKSGTNSMTLRVGQDDATVDVLIECKEAPFELRAEEIDEDLRGHKKPTRLGIELIRPIKQATVRMTIRPVGS